MTEKGYNATVVQKILATPGLMILRVAPDGGTPEFTPGQYTVLGLYSDEPRVQQSEPDWKTYEERTLIRRAYSITSASVEKEYLEFYISLVRSGQLTPRLFALEIGSRLFTGGKAVGMFTLRRVPREKHILLIATGTGLAPYMSMIRSELNLKEPRRFVVLHGAGCSWDLGYRDELATLDRLVDHFHYLPTITEPEKDPSWKGLTGYIQPILESGVIEDKTGMKVSPENFDAFLCGNPVMVEDVTAMLVDKGFEVDEGKRIGTIHMERFWK